MAVLSSCAGDDSAPAGEGGTTSAASGFATMSTGTSSGTTSSADSTSTTGSASGDLESTSSAGTLSDTQTETEGPRAIAGLLTFVHRAPHPLDSVGAVGLAGGYRTTEVGWDGVDDLYAPVAYQLAFPALPEVGEVSADGPIGSFAWGGTSDWILAGNGLKLAVPDGPEVLACRIALEATVANPDGYPVYVTSATQAEACAASPDAFVGETTYDVVLYGGDAFVDNVLPARVTTPAKLDVVSPDMSVYGLAIDATGDLVVEWGAGRASESSIEIRLLDGDGTLVSAHAMDDGAFVVPAADLQTLAPGPLDVMVARRRSEEVAFSEGTITVMMRSEQWGFFDLY